MLRSFYTAAHSLSVTYIVAITVFYIIWVRCGLTEHRTKQVVCERDTVRASRSACQDMQIKTNGCLCSCAGDELCYLLNQRFASLYSYEQMDCLCTCSLLRRKAMSLKLHQDLQIGTSGYVCGAVPEAHHVPKTVPGITYMKKEEDMFSVCAHVEEMSHTTNL